MSFDQLRPLGGDSDRPTPPATADPAWRYPTDARLEPKSGAERRALFARGDRIISYVAFCAWVEASEKAGKWLDVRQFKEKAAGEAHSA